MLHQPFVYLLFAPITRLLDELSMLSNDQHAALVASLGFVAALMTARGAWSARASAPIKRLRAAARGFGRVFAGALGMYLIGALLPRPMVSLRPSHPDDVLVDFHSHTTSSHDGRWRFGAAANRAWHAAAGFNAAYITDHQTMDAWLELARQGALSGNQQNVATASVLGGTSAPRQTILLPGIETVVPGAHINFLGVSAAHASWFVHRRNLDTVAFTTPIAGVQRPLALLTLPFDINRSPAGVPHLDAIEISDGAPRGLGFARRYRVQIQALADSLRVPVVASSNTHGWGATAVAWTAMRIPGWRTLSPKLLDEHIRALLQTPNAQVSVVERNGLAEARSGLATLLTLPRFLAQIWRMAEPLERASAVAWIWILWLLSLQPARLARRKPAYEH